MPTTDICHGTAMVALAPLLGPAIVLVVLGIQRLAPKGTRRVTPPGWRVTVLMLVLSAAGGVALRSTFNESFHAYGVSGGAVSLAYFWPKGDIVLPGASVDSVSVVRGRTWDKHGAEDARWWLRLTSGNEIYTSCETGIMTELVAEGREIAAALGRSVDWRVRCPSAQPPVASTEQVIAAPGKLEVPPACTKGGS